MDRSALRDRQDLKLVASLFVGLLAAFGLIEFALWGLI